MAEGQGHAAAPVVVRSIESATAAIRRLLTAMEVTPFALYPGHEIRAVEEIVEKHSGYHVVRRDQGAAAELAEATDPRSS